jgi:hypothetical protein
MADNTEEENLDSPKTDQPENTPVENIRTQDSPASESPNLNPEIANMEVHHHPDLHHDPKKWKEYFLEFLMIFLAVTLGFFAEGLRENLSDRNKEKEYIESLVADLKNDQQVLSQHIVNVKTGISMMDSMIAILDTPAKIAGNTGELYFLARLSPRLNPLANNDRTYEQLKNSGNFRLIRNLNTSNEIMAYYEKFPLIRLLESINETEFTEFKKSASKIFNPAILLKMESRNNEIIRISDNPPLRSMDNELLQELSVFAVYMHGTKKGVLTAAEELKIAGNELIGYLQKQYHLE